MENKIIKFDEEKCTGCEECELVCSFYHFEKSLISLSRVIVYKDKSKGIFIPVSCISCPGMPCSKVCPTNAIIHDEKTNMPKIIEDKCLGKECGKCVNACPYDAIRFNYKVYTYPLICDLCGGDPECVKICPTNALDFIIQTLNNEKSRFKKAMINHTQVISIKKSFGGIAYE
ncbi:MAG: 4Fe-4S dicluster domain-containing protein [Candidatus Nanopusillus acidilobi]|jgi:Fe-S-cluster-containing hydrogenase component 2